MSKALIARNDSAAAGSATLFQPKPWAIIIPPQKAPMALPRLKAICPRPPQHLAAFGVLQQQDLQRR
ncbi:hypothetical protein BANRA_02438 [Klebsiella pneumoniae]|nr:hypothetical protein BANRA_02438 [Klebsiella pneumoniae]